MFIPHIFFLPKDDFEFRKNIKWKNIACQYLLFGITPDDIMEWVGSKLTSTYIGPYQILHILPFPPPPTPIFRINFE